MNNILIFVMFMNVFGFGSKTERKPKCLSISGHNCTYDLYMLTTKSFIIKLSKQTERIPGSTMCPFLIEINPTLLWPLQGHNDHSVGSQKRLKGEDNTFRNVVMSHYSCFHIPLFA